MQLTGNAVLIADAFYRKGNLEYGTLGLSDGTRHCRILVPSDAIPHSERIRHEPGLPVRVEVRSETVKLRVKGEIFDKRTEVLIAHSFEVLEQ